MPSATRILDANVNGTVYTSNANNALEAIDTSHSGTTAPTDQVANGKLWLDTSITPGVLKVYNNAAWAVIGGIIYIRKTSNYTAVTRDGIVADTTGGTFVITLPLTPLVGDQVVISDGGDWSTTNLVVGRNGSTIEGDAADMTMDVGGVSVTFVYDGTTWQIYTTAASNVDQFATAAQGALADTSVQPSYGPSIYAAYGGTGNVITLTTGLGLASLSTGLELRFRAGATNTVATTINVDVIGAVTALTITGSSLPAGYIRIDADTVIRYNGTNWIVDRQIESGSNANGDYTKFADGSQQCWDIEDLGAPSTWAGTAGARYKDRTWTFPSAFSAIPYGLCNGDQDQTGPAQVGNINTAVRDKTLNSTTAMKVAAREIYTASTGSVVVSVHAFGKWY
jgi:hypothetical protein